MHKGLRNAFTLIEVMVSVVIISTVILALLTMGGNNTHLFSSFKEQSKINQYASFFISNPTYGLEDDSVVMDDLLSEFNVEDDLRRELKEIKVELLYKIVEQIDLSEYEDSDDEAQEGEYDEENSEDESKDTNSTLIIEIGRTTLKLQDSSTALLRIQIQ